MQKRREQRWVSHNKVLVGSGDGNGSKKPHARNPNFDSEETKLLIQLWGNPQIQRTLLTIHKKNPVISKIADKMRSYGYNRSTEEINTRIKNLKCLYNRIKKDLDSGLLNEPSWKHYNAMDEILSRPVFGNKNVTSSNTIAPVCNKIIISPSFSPSDSEQQMFQVKEEETSDGENETGEIEDKMDYEGSELRPEDLLSVVEVDDHDTSDVDIKEEPMDVSTIIETKSEEKTDADSSTDTLKKSIDTMEVNLASAVNRNIINYQNDSPLSIASVHGNGTTTTITQVSPNSSSVANKISLVPTKLLLKTQTGFKSPPPLATPTSTILTTTNAQSTSQSISMPMKVVFVNALNGNSHTQQNATKQQLITLNKSQAQQIQNQSSSSTFITNKIIGQAQPTKVQLVSQSIVSTASSIVPNNIAKVSIATSSHRHEPQEGKKAKSSKSLLGSNNKLPVIRNLLTNIVEIENQRLEIERERLEYEKKVGNELLSLLKNFIGFNSTKINESDEKPKPN